MPWLKLTGPSGKPVFVNTDLIILMGPNSDSSGHGTDLLISGNSVVKVANALDEIEDQMAGTAAEVIRRGNLDPTGNS